MPRARRKRPSLARVNVLPGTYCVAAAVTSGPVYHICLENIHGCGLVRFGECARMAKLPNSNANPNLNTKPLRLALRGHVKSGSDSV